MNNQMAYLLGMILGNGEIQQNEFETTVTVDIPHKNLRDDSGLEVAIYVGNSLVNIRNILEPLIGEKMTITRGHKSTCISFNKNNEDYVIREILRFIGNGVHHTSMVMDADIFNITKNQKLEFLRGFADVTGYIRRANNAYGVKTHHRVYLEIPSNWQMVIDICNILKSIDVPVQTIDFGHPNCRDPKLAYYKKGNKNYWKKEHQIKIWANEFLPIGFNIVHKQNALQTYSAELLSSKSPESTHKYYWETKGKKIVKLIHPMENDDSIPSSIRGKHYNSWRNLAEDLGYHE